jgi:hypothetical protein
MPEPWKVLTCGRSMPWWPLQLYLHGKCLKLTAIMWTHTMFGERDVWLVSALNLIKQGLHQALEAEWPSSHSCYLILRTLTNYHTLPPDIYSHMTITASRHVTLKITAETFAEIFSYWFRQSINTVHNCQDCIMRYKRLIYEYTQSVQ